MKAYLLFLLIAFCFCSSGQVSRVKERSSTNMSFESLGTYSSEYSNSGVSTGDDEGFFFSLITEASWQLIQLPFKGMYQWQRWQLNRADSDSWRVSLEG
ncbi:MAG: hypothetical protein AAFN93_29715, partial [Bacteroidota bacterium]